MSRRATRHAVLSELRVARSRCLPCHVEAVARDAERAAERSERA